MNYLRSLYFSSFVILLFFWNCSGEKKNGIPGQINEQDKSVFFLTSKGGIWWWLHPDQENKTWWLYITDVQSKQLLASTIFSSVSATDFEFSFQQTGDKLWYINPEGKLEARNLLDGTVTENETVLHQKFPNLKSSIISVKEANPLSKTGYFFKLLNNQEMYFDNVESLLMDRTALSNTFNQKEKTVTYLAAAGSCEKSDAACGTKVFIWVKKMSYSYAPAPVGGWKLECSTKNNSDFNSLDTIKLQRLTLEEEHKASSFYNKDDLFAFCVFIKERDSKQFLQLDCFDKRTFKLFWSKTITELKPRISTCEQIENSFSLSVLKGEVLIQETKNSNSGWTFKIGDGSLSWQTGAADLLNSLTETK